MDIKEVAGEIEGVAKIIHKVVMENYTGENVAPVIVALIGEAGWLTLNAVDEAEDEKERLEYIALFDNAVKSSRESMLELQRKVMERRREGQQKGGGDGKWKSGDSEIE